MAKNTNKTPTGAQTSGDTMGTYNPSAQDQAKANLVIERYELAHKHQYPFWIDFDRYYKMYESYVNEQKAIYQTKIFIPMVFSVIERFLPRIISNKPTVNFLPRLNQQDFFDQASQTQTLSPDDAIAQAMARAQRVQSLFSWQWDQVSRLKDGGMFMEQLRFVKDALINGTAIAKIPWKMESRETRVYNNSNEVEKRIVKYFDGPDFEVIDPYDFFFDPEAVDMQRASWVIHRTRKTLDEMREINASKGVEIYKNLHILESMTPDTLSATENDFKYRRKVALGGGQVLVQDDTTDKFEIMECWGMFPKFDNNGMPTEDKELEPRVIVLANRKVVVRDIPYPYWHGKKPFIKFTPFPRTYEFYGIPIIKHLERIQFYMNEFVAQKFDNQVLSLNQMLVVDPAANVEDWQLVMRPGGVIRANKEQIMPLPLGDVTTGVDDSLNYLTQTSQLTTGLSDYYSAGVNGQDNPQNKTATGANAVEEQIAIRVNQVVQIYEEQIIREIGYQWHGLDGQFIKVPQVVRSIGSDGKPKFPMIMPEDIRYDYDIIPEAGSTQPSNPTLDRNQFLQAIQVIQGNPVMANQTDWQQVEKELWQKFGVKEGDKLMVTTPGSNPQQMPGGQALPGAGQGSGQTMGSAPVSPANSPAQLQQGAMQPYQGFGPAPAQPEAPEKPEMNASVSIKIADLTPAEQAQVLAQHGIKADMPTRMVDYANQRQQAKHDRNMDLAQQHIQMMPKNALQGNLT